MMRSTRRQFLRHAAAGGAVAAAGPLARAAGGPKMANFTVRCFGAAGKPLPAANLGGLFALEALGDRNPIPHPPREITDGVVRLTAPAVPFALSHMTRVEGFGTVRLYADNDGRGYQAGQDVSLARELASSRLAAVEAFGERARRQGFTTPAAVTGRLEKARALLAQADAADAPERSSPPAMESLRESLWAGEEIAFAHAQWAIGRRGPRKDFRFGCNFFGYPAQGEAYAEAFAGLLNFATLPFYWRSFEPEPGKPGFDRVDAMLARLEKSGIAAKGHPLCWFHEAGCPTWMAGKSFEEWREGHRRRITEIVSRYRGRIPVYDVINEAHDWGNDPQFTQEQLLEMTRVAADATHAADPNAVRVVNNCCLFAEYAASGATYKGPQPRPLRTPLQYLRAVVAAGVDFDAVGLQVYYPEHDMFEIARMLDRFAALGKPLHVTELGVSSNAGRDERAHGQEPTGRYWHAPWSETVQADWVEQFYTLCYAHPAVEAVTWWDFSDAGGHFWPHGGFLRPDGQPKESYHRLRGLIAAWQQKG